MIEKDDFYANRDLPSEATKEKMWRFIRRSSAPLRREPWLVRDRRSFAFGMAASVILGLAVEGAWSIAHQALENAQPQPLRIEQAYVAAIHEFERLVPSSAVQNRESSQAAGELKSRQEQLDLINAAIADLRKTTSGRDLSPLIRERLRELYSQELKLLQLMIEQGEVEL